ncbi:MAG: 50S ribosomal protein L13 [Bacteroidetes bacterium]|nr:MAG: 50S ribosomal protein L13 [Bacteroidota bacterium]
MDTRSYKTQSANPQTVEKKWLVVDLEGKVLGRAASQIAMLLRGKHKPYYTPHVDCGDNVIVINADKVRLTGNKWAQKTYIRHTGYPGGQRVRTASELMTKFPTRMVEKAVKGMLPKNKLGRHLFGNLRVYAGAEHPHEAQEPEVFELS